MKNEWDILSHYGQNSALNNNVLETINNKINPSSGELHLTHGMVTFSNFPSEKLKDFAIIPEDKSYYNGKVFTPQNMEYKHVDGFFWKGKPSSWFKIPGNCHALIKNSINTFVFEQFRGVAAIAKGVKCDWTQDDHWALEQNPF